MQIIEKDPTSNKKDSYSYKNYKGKKLKSHRKSMAIYNKLLEQVEDLGVISIEFDKDFSYKKKIKILQEIIERQK